MNRHKHKAAMYSVFQAFADNTGFPVDQVRYVVLLFLSYPLAYVFHYVLHPAHTSLLTRHIFSISFGLLFGFLCFGIQMFILFGIVGVSYAMLRWMPATVVQRYTMVWAMGSMSVAHYYRLVTDYGGWTLDFSIPLQVVVQKITLVAFALHDGKSRKDSSLNADQRAQKIDACPSLLEYFTYIFNFHSILAGPSCTIREFMSFMDGSNLQPPENPNEFAKAKEHIKEPSATFAVVTKLIYSLCCLGNYVFLSQYFHREMVTAPEYSILKRMAVVAVYIFKIRTKYYFAWFLSDSISNLAGLGFNGYDKKGMARWDLVTNVYLWEFETGNSLRNRINHWHFTTSVWLRRVCYERMTVSPTLATYMLSAWWHGFYPGYYLSFVFLGIAIEASRKMRRLVRHHFQGSLPLKWTYNFITFLFAHICLDYGIMPFDLMWLPESLLFWSYWYYVPVVTICVVAFLFPSGKSSRPKEVKVQPGEQNGEIARPREVNVQPGEQNGEIARPREVNVQNGMLSSDNSSSSKEKTE